ncbi:MAG TPA: heterodisulfide reductase-related iron-sulfur binding cluster [Candidatus Binataceae bacterium]|nr:heterodisulfide reductase-related iron-sulfur binding cluster [Candidatus Binataceae bacterium]
MSRIEGKPSDGLSYSPAEAKYWDPAGLAKEIDRVYDICLGCRLCFNLCGSFPELFDAADAKEQEVRNLSAAERDRVVDLCYDCKLCYLRCPYTPRDGHEFQLDFPRLMLRARAVKARKHGVPLREKLLGNPNLLGKLGSKSPGLANWGCRQPLQRVVMEKLLGIARDKLLPEFVGETFEKWLRRNPLPAAPSAPAAKVILFYTCYGNYYGPGPAQAAIKVLARNRCALACPTQGCCGMPALDGGDVAFAQKQARANVASMLPLVRQGYKVAAINPTCSLTMRQEYPDLLGTAEARELAAAVVDTHEVLYDLRRKGLMDRDFRSTPGTVAYHLPCHLKAQNIGMRSRDLIRSIPGAEVTTVDACTAHDGTWAMKREFFALSMKLGAKAFAGMSEAGAKVLASDCQLAALQIEQATGLRPLHPIEVLARAYEPDGFPDPVPPPAPETPTGQ